MKSRTVEQPAERPKSRPGRAIAENIEVFILAGLASLLVRCFVVEPFQIPTGSMAPTIMGNHRVIKCANCGYAIDVGKVASISSPPSIGRCPICGYVTELRAEDATWGDRFLDRIMLGSNVWGDRIVVNKFAYDFREPKRWEVFVFIEPEDSNNSPDKKNFIKRLIGLPGERLNIRNGDIYVNGELARKPVRVQRHLWQLIYDSQRVFKDERSFWSKSPDNWREMEDFLELPSPVGQSPARAVFNKNGGIKDFCAYSSGGSSRRGWFAVPDVRFAADLEPLSDKGQFRIRFECGHKTIELELAFGKAPGSTLTIVRHSGTTYEQRQVMPIDVPVFEKGRTRRIDLWHADHTVRFFVDKQEVLVHEESDTSLADAPRTPPKKSGIVLELTNAAARLADIQVYRDIYYISRANRVYLSPTGEIVVPEDCFFAMGDNSPFSNDSRAWGPVPRNNIVGHALLAWWPIQRWNLIH